MPDVPKIGLMLDASRGVCGAFLRGVVHFAELQGPWQFVVADGVGLAAIERLENLAAGVIVQVDDSAMAERVERLRVPALALRTCPGEAARRSPVGQIHVDFYGAARLAAEHLLERGLRSFAFVGAGDDASRQAADAERGFSQRIQQIGGAVETFAGRTGSDLSSWLTALPRPTGIMAWNDVRGREVLDACLSAGLTVPRDLAVIAVEEDDLLCELADPPLTTVTLKAEAAGLRAAQSLCEMIHRGTRAETITISAGAVAERGSTQTVDVDDLQVAAALQLIHRHATQPIGVEDIVGGLPISRRALELRFRKAVGRGPHAELQRARLLRAQQLLVQTDLPIPQVAEASGYSSGSYLAQVFQRRVAMSPAQYRRAHRGTNSAACG